MDTKIVLLLGAIVIILLLLIVDVPFAAPLSIRDKPLPAPPSVIVEHEAADAPLPEPVPIEELPVIAEAVAESTAKPLASSTFLMIEGSCGPYFGDACVNIRSGPSTSTSRVLFARNGMLLPVDETLEYEGRTWYRIIFTEWLRFSDRVSGPWYIASGYGSLVETPAETHLEASTTASTTKRILVDRSEQMLYAYDGDTLFMEEKISTGLDLTPTPRGVFTVFRKTPSRYMQGPLAGISDDYYDLPGVPWNLYFTPEGGAIHGTYWHDHFGTKWSHGCVNLPPDKARMLYEWAPLGTTVVVRD